MTPHMIRLMSRSDEFRSMWIDVHASKGYISQRLRCTSKDLEWLRLELGLQEKVSPSHLPAWEPTEDEIQERLAEFRAKWSRRSRRSRETSDIPRSPRLKEFSFCVKTMSLR